VLDQAQALLNWISAHPGGSLILLFVVAMVDALFLLGAFVPAAIVLFGMGALIALGSLNLWSTALIAAAGALAGDAISFAMGRRYGDQLFESRLMRRYPDLIHRGREFFTRHGGKGVMLARFLGPVRSITPALAGASGMSAWVFILVDLPAALVWALIYLVPGILFGASLGLAAEVATRLAGLLVAAIGLIILGIWLIRTAVALFNLHAERWVRMLLSWSRRHRRLGRFGPGLADPTQPETPALIAVALLLLLFGALWLIIFDGALWRDIPSAADALIHQSMSDLSTPWGSAIAHYLSRLGQWPVYASTAAAVLACLLWRNRMRAAAHWIAALMFGLSVTLLLECMPLVAPPTRYFGHIALGTPLRDLVMPTIIYGFAATLFATLRSSTVRLVSYAIASALIVLISLSRLVLAQEWASLITFALIMSLMWIFALTLGYRQHRPERLSTFSFMTPVLAAFAVAASMSWGVDRAVSRLDAHIPLAAQHVLNQAHWWKRDWDTLPSARIDVRGRPSRPFDFQWAGSLDQLQTILEANHWELVPPLRATDSLRWLTQSTSISELPVLPQVHAGRHPQLSFRRTIDDQRQYLIRLWDSGVHVRTAYGEVPVWLGLTVEQGIRSGARLFRYPVTLDHSKPPMPLSPEDPSMKFKLVASAGNSVWLIQPAKVHYTPPQNDARRPDERPASETSH
tara:strand:- start:4200 stop:6260 length:2061 start_codon:yes stop_codon:yes gene_type:complete